MPVHDWGRVEAGAFHHFHQTWAALLGGALNQGILPKGYSAYVEYRAGRAEPDILALSNRFHEPQVADDLPAGGLAVEVAPPQVEYETAAEAASYAARADRVAVRTRRGRLVALIEIVSPGNKDARSAFEEFVDKMLAFLRRGVHLVVVDLHMPTARDPLGIHRAIWDNVSTVDPFEPPPGRPLTLASYVAGPSPRAYVQPAGIGSVLPDMPIFLTDRRYVPAPLETTYAQAWSLAPPDLRDDLEPPDIRAEPATTPP